MRCLVVCALALMMLNLSPTRRFISVDFPTLGEPMMLTKPALCSADAIVSDTDVNLFLQRTTIGLSSPSRFGKMDRGVEQLVARRAHNPKVAGSSPATATRSESLKKKARVDITSALFFALTGLFALELSTSHCLCLREGCPERAVFF